MIEAVEEKSAQTAGPIVIIDFLNTFVRNFAAFPQFSPNGEQIGGVVGTIKKIANIVNQFKPSRVFVVTEGGGSAKRRGIMKGYKENRRPLKVNRSIYEDDLPESDNNFELQKRWIGPLIDALPVCKLYIEDVEADDVIAYLCKRKFGDRQKIIVSTDKDMYQLLDEKTSILDLNRAKKEGTPSHIAPNLITPKIVAEEFQISVQNFALAKCVAGDSSDNISSIGGVGFKTIAKKFPIMRLEKELMISDLINYSRTRINESKAYEKVVKSEAMIKQNWRLIYLDGSMISASGVEKLENAIDNFIPRFDKVSFVKSAIAIGAVQKFSVDEILYSMRHLVILQ